MAGDGIVPAAAAGQLVLVQAELDSEVISRRPGDLLGAFHTALVRCADVTVGRVAFEVTTCYYLMLSWAL